MKSFDFYFAYCLGKAIKDKMKNLSKSFKLCAAEGQDLAAKIIRKLQGLQQKSIFNLLNFIQLYSTFPTNKNHQMYSRVPNNRPPLPDC